MRQESALNGGPKLQYLAGWRRLKVRNIISHLTAEYQSFFSSFFCRLASSHNQHFPEAIHNKDFDTFARISIKDSDDFHHVCHITEPPLHYMNDTSRLIVDVVNLFNDSAKDNKWYESQFSSKLFPTVYL